MSRIGHIYIAVVVAVSALSAARPGHAEPQPLAAKVVWAGPARIFVAGDSLRGLESGDFLRIRERGRVLASAEVVLVLEDHLASARIVSGSLRGARRLERLSVDAERPVPRSPAMLRLGVPAFARGELLDACDSALAIPAGGESLYVADAGAARVTRLTRIRPASPWPDTLLVRRFADAAEEEIALERGEIEVALFWPEEIAGRSRDGARGGPAAGSWLIDRPSLDAPPGAAAVACAPAARAVVRTIGAARLARLLECGVSWRQP